MTKRDPRSFLAAFLRDHGYAHEVAEKLVQNALDAYAHELAEKIRAHDWDSHTIGARCCDALTDEAADLIDPETNR